MKRKFKNGKSLKEFVKNQINVDIEVDDTFKMKRGIVYMYLPDNAPLRTLLCKQGIRCDRHMKDRYWLYLV